MRTYSQFLEDLEQRKVALAQRRQQQMARIKQQNAQTVSDAEREIFCLLKQQGAENDAEMKRKQDAEKEKRAAAQAARDEAEAERDRETSNEG